MKLQDGKEAPEQESYILHFQFASKEAKAI